jgi:hypothetical protein
MNTTDLLVIVGGIAAIVWVNWYFFFAGRSPAKAAVGDEQASEHAHGG